MAVLDRIPELGTPTSVVDVRDTLNANGGSVNDTGNSLFSAKANINIWSKRKPVCSPTLPFLTTEQMATAGGSTENRYGLTLIGGAAAQPNAMLSLFKIAEQGIIYDLPKGGTSTPFRLSDFNGYAPKAIAPIITPFKEEVEIVAPASDNSSGVSLNFIKVVDDSASANGGLTFEDIFPNPVSPVGVVFSWKNCLYVQEVGNTSNTAILYDEISAAWLRRNGEKEFTAMQFISTTRNTNSNAPDSLTFSTQYALPFPLFTLKVKSYTGGGGDSGNTGVQGDIVINMAVGYPVFNGPTNDVHRSVIAKFTLTVVGGTGNISNFTAGIYKDKNCSLSERVAYVAYGDFTDLRGSNSYTAPLTNNSGLSNLYFGVYFNQALQYSTKVMQPKQEI